MFEFEEKKEREVELFVFLEIISGIFFFRCLRKRRARLSLLSFSGLSED